MASKDQEDKKAQEDSSYDAIIERAKNFVDNGSNEIIVDLKEHKKDLEEFIMRPLQIKQTIYEKLEAMVKKYNKKKAPEEQVDEVEYLERIINEIYKIFVKKNTRKCQK